LKICAEIYYSISHDLLSIDPDLGDIRTIYSHPHAFAQCRKWLEKHLPGANLVECSSTAEAARKASGEPGAAAIASREAAQSYKRRAGAPDRRSFPQCHPLFGNREGRESRTGADKTSIMFVTAHVPSALFRVFKPIAEATSTGLTGSRPPKHKIGAISFSRFGGTYQ
jgi:chorismate mutase/prephenate dehydratase